MLEPLPQPCADAILDGSVALSKHRQACRHCKTRQPAEQDVLPGLETVQTTPEGSR